MTRSRRATAALIAAAVAVTAVIAVLVNRAEQANQAAAAPAAAGPTESKCGLTGTKGTPLQIQTTWENVAGWPLPISAVDGPGVRNPTGPWSCYARTPAGAVVAGYTIGMRVDGVAEDWQTATKVQTMPGPAQEAHLQRIPTQGDPTTPKGFTLTAYSDTRATIAYYLTTGGYEASCTIDVAWFEGDWRLVLQPDGQTASGCTPGVPATFTPWGP